MEIVIENPKLKFLHSDGSVLRTQVPVKVIRSAREKFLLIKAVPAREYLTNWRSLGYRSDPELGDGFCSVSLHGSWRMGMVQTVRNDREMMLVIRIWNAANDF